MLEVCTVMGMAGVPQGNCCNGDHIHGNTAGTLDVVGTGTGVIDRVGKNHDLKKSKKSDFFNQIAFFDFLNFFCIFQCCCALLLH